MAKIIPDMPCLLLKVPAINIHYINNHSMYSLALPPVVIIRSVGEIELKEGERAEFICEATGVGANNFRYQWFLNKERVDGQDAQKYIVSSVTEDNAGDYTCSVQNRYEVIGRSNNIITLVLGT